LQRLQTARAAAPGRNAALVVGQRGVGFSSMMQWGDRRGASPGRREVRQAGAAIPGVGDEDVRRGGGSAAGRSAAGVSPVRDGPPPVAARAAPGARAGFGHALRGGAASLRWMSLLRALRGEDVKDAHPHVALNGSGSRPGGRREQARKAAECLARARRGQKSGVCCRAAMAGQPSRCGGVGLAPGLARNHCPTAGRRKQREGVGGIHEWLILLCAGFRFVSCSTPTILV